MTTAEPRSRPLTFSGRRGLQWLSAHMPESILESCRHQSSRVSLRYKPSGSATIPSAARQESSARLSRRMILIPFSGFASTTSAFTTPRGIISMVCRKTKSSDFRKAPSPGIARHGRSHRILATQTKATLLLTATFTAVTATILGFYGEKVPPRTTTMGVEDVG